MIPSVKEEDKEKDNGWKTAHYTSRCGCTGG